MKVGHFESQRKSLCLSVISALKSYHSSKKLSQWLICHEKFGLKHVLSSGKKANPEPSSTTFGWNSYNKILSIFGWKLAGIKRLRITYQVTWMLEHDIVWRFITI